MRKLRGTVLERDGSTYRVMSEHGVIRAVLRGKAKREPVSKVVVGDRVSLDYDAGAGEVYGIVGVEERRSLLERRTPDGRGTRPVAANVDQVLVVTATVDPTPVPQLIDRLLVVAEANSIPAAVILNKVDLDRGELLAGRFRSAGYEVNVTSVKTGEGLAALKARLIGHITVVAGPSGAGKSSLLNAAQPGLTLRVGEISGKVRRGRNTTVAAVMIPLVEGGFLVDTPGLSEVGLWNVDPSQLDRCFPEMQPYLGQCKYANCHHVGEPRCAVAAAVEAGKVLSDRLESYRKLLRELEEQPEEWE